jgi:hypothetical protein
MSTEVNICGSKSKSPMAERAINGDVFETIEFDILFVLIYSTTTLKGTFIIDQRKWNRRPSQLAFFAADY